jgi:Cu/Ag efflux pump CusA
MAGVDGAVDVSLEQQVDIPQLAIIFDRERIANHGLRTGALAELIETVYTGHEVTQVLEGQRTYDLVVRYPDSERADLEAIHNTLIDTPSGAKIPLRMLADIRKDTGPNTINRENVQRKLVIQANTSGRDLGSVIADIRDAVTRQIKLPAGYYVLYGGQFESEREASRTISLLSVFVIAGIFLLLFLAFRKVKTALLIMVNVPLALIGGVFAVWLSGGVISIASLVGFVTLFGIATRNGIMLVAHIRHLVHEEGVTDLDVAVRRGASERLVPILMTALAAGLGLVPLALSAGEPGSEIQAPMAIVILCGLLTSTALNMFVVPALYRRFGSLARTPSGGRDATLPTAAVPTEHP